MSIRKDFTIDFMRLLDHLRSIAVEKPRTFAGLTVGYRREDIGLQIEKLRASLPREMKEAATLTRESERMLESAGEEAKQTLEQARREAERVVTEARREAERTLEQARLTQEQMVEQSEVLKLAKAQAEEIRSETERECRQMRQGAERYAMDTLGQLGDVVGRVLSQIERGKEELEPTEAAKAHAARMRDRVKAQ